MHTRMLWRSERNDDTVWYTHAFAWLCDMCARRRWRSYRVHCATKARCLRARARTFSAPTEEIVVCMSLYSYDLGWELCRLGARRCRCRRRRRHRWMWSIVEGGSIVNALHGVVMMVWRWWHVKGDWELCVHVKRARARARCRQRPRHHRRTMNVRV